MYVCLLVLVVAIGIAAAQDGGDVEVGENNAGVSSSGSKTVQGDYSKSQYGVDTAAASGPDFPVQDFWIKPIAVGFPHKLPKKPNTPLPSLVFYNTRNQLGGSKHPEDTTTEEVTEHETSDAPHHHRRREMQQRIREREEEMEALTARVTKRRHVSMEDVLKPQVLLVEKTPNRMRDHEHSGGPLGGGFPMMKNKKKRRGLGGRRNSKSRSLPAPDGTGRLPTDTDDDVDTAAGDVDESTPFKAVLTYIPFSTNSPIHDITSDHMENVLSHGEVDTGLLGGRGGMDAMELVGFRATSSSDHRPTVTFLKAYFPETSTTVFPDDVIHTTGYSYSELRNWFNETSVPLKHVKAMAIIHHAPQLRRLVGSSIASRPLDVEVEAPSAAYKEVEEDTPTTPEGEHPHHHIHRMSHHRPRHGGGSWSHGDVGGAILLSDYHIAKVVETLKEALYARVAAGGSTFNGRAKEALTAFVANNLSRFRIVSRIPTAEEAALHDIETELREKTEESEMDPSERARFRQTIDFKKKHRQQQGGGRHRRPHMGLGRRIHMGGEREVDHTNEGNTEVTVIAFAIVKTA